MRRTSPSVFVLPLATIVVLVVATSFGSAQTDTRELSQSYVCGFSQEQVPVYDMKQPVVGYIETIDRWVTFERGEVLLDHSVTHYFTWDGLDWTFNFLPLVGDLVEIPYDYELWVTTTLTKFGTSLIGAFNQGVVGPNCWREETLAGQGVTTARDFAPVYAPMPPGVIGDF